MSVHKKLQEVSVELQSTPLKKSGKNKFSGFSYFELGDFLPTVNKLFLEKGLNGYVSFDSELAMLVVTDTEDGSQLEVCSPMVSISMKGANEIQNLGAVQTYQRRYLYLAALGIVENDIVDSQELKHDIKVTLATKTQVDTIIDLVSQSKDETLGDTILGHFGVKSFKELTQEQASATIKKLNG